MGNSSADFLDSRAVDCQIDPASIDPADIFEDRDTTMNYNCRPAEANFVNENVPIYQVLQEGQMPGDSGRPNGWYLTTTLNREIDKRPSAGPKSALIRLGGLDIAEPSCASVRGAAFPAF